MSVKKSFYDLVPNVSRYELNDWFDLGIKLGISKETLILTLCKEYDLYFDYTLARNIGTLGSYIKDISIFPQYEGKKFKDSLFENIDGVPVSYNLKAEKKLDLLTALKNEQQLLLGKMKKVMEEDNVGTYKNLVLALKEITGLAQNEEKNRKSYPRGLRREAGIIEESIDYSAWEKPKTSSKKVVSKNPDNKDVCVYCGKLLEKEYNPDIDKIEYSCTCKYFQNHCEMNLDLAMTNMDFERTSDGTLENSMYEDCYWSSFNQYQMKDRLIQIDDDCRMILRERGVWNGVSR